MKNDFIYDKVNALVIKQLKKGVVPWHKPWKSSTPRNVITKKAYHGSNIFTLYFTQEFMQYKSGLWGTFLQWNSLKIDAKKGVIKTGEKSTPVLFWDTVETDKVIKNNKGEEEPERYMVLRYSNVFNLDQCENVKPQEELVDPPLNKTADDIISNYQKEVPIFFEGEKAYYVPSEDIIKVPQQQKYDSIENYYATLFHEMTHSTGHEKRLNRKLASENVHFGDEEYSKEELVAEMGAIYLCSKVGVVHKTIKNSTAYIQSWLKRLEEDKTLIVSAGSKAQKAVDYILGI